MDQIRSIVSPILHYGHGVAASLSSNYTNVSKQNSNTCISFHTLPYDILLDIILYLPLGDVVTLSHTCRTLRNCTSEETIWRQALSHQGVRGGPPIPDASTPLLVPETLQLKNSIPSTIFHRERIPFTANSHTTEWRPRVSLRDRYWDSLRARKALAEPTITIEPILGAVYGIPRKDLHTIGLSTGGEVFFVWREDQLRVFDLRAFPVVCYTVLFIEKGSHHRTACKDGWHVVHPIRYQNQYGVLFAGKCISSATELFFLPLHTSIDNGLSPVQSLPIYLGAISVTPRTQLDRFQVSGKFFITVERSPQAGMSWFRVRVIDFTSGHRFSITNDEIILSETFRIHIGILEGTYLLVQAHDLLRCYSLDTLREAEGPPHETSSAICHYGHASGTITIPKHLSKLSETGERFLKLWRFRSTWSSTIGMASAALPDNMENGRRLNFTIPPRWETDYPPELVFPELRQFRSRWLDGFNQLRNVEVGAHRAIQGYDRILCLVSSEPDVLQAQTMRSLGAGTQRTALVMTELSPAGDSLVHKPVMIFDARTKRAVDINGIAKEKGWRRYGDPTVFAWSEVSGRLGICTAGSSPGVVDVVLYQVCLH
ncbi:hypothetical protein DL93DRAFT_2232775 [Clavulina sp. PMI_390]|nr:hypothetical protein DL93DRAFT_2232775 [Clavulina sp. PMI_390]